MITQFNCQKHFYFKLFSLFKPFYIKNHFSVSTVSISKTVQFQIIPFNLSTQLECKYGLIVQIISISLSQAVLTQLIQLIMTADFVYTQLNVKALLR